MIAQANAYINGDISANSTYTYSTQTTETISFAGDTNGFGQALLLTQTQHTVESLSIDMGDGNIMNDITGFDNVVWNRDGNDIENRLSTVGVVLSSAGAYGDKLLKSGKYIQSSGVVGNFNNVNSGNARLAKNFATNISKIGKGANILTGVVIAHDILSDGTLKSSNAVNGVLLAATIAFPVIAPFTLAYGVLDYTFGISQAIDNNFGEINTGIYD